MPPADGSGPLLADDGFRAALDAMQDHVAIGAAVRQDGAIVDFELRYLNDASIDGAGRSREELVGRRVCELYPNWVESGLFDRFSQVVERREPFVADRLRYDDIAPDGTVITGWWSLSIAPFEDGYIASSRDVTHLVRAEQARRSAQAEAEHNRMAVALLQRAAMPSRLPEVAGLELVARYEHASLAQPVGGDWYDAFTLSEGQVGLVIADVAGHGPDAAAFMVQVRNIVRALAIEHVDPGLVLTQANQIVCRLDEVLPFATTCLAVVDVAAGTFSWALAGHLPPLHRAARTGAASYPVAPVGPPLGVDPAAVHTTTVIAVEPGDVVLLLTDGLVEVRDRAIGASLDDLSAWVERLGDVSAHDLADAVVARAGAHRDDAALLIARLCPGLVH